jgi:flagellar basal body-associated protein FliL
MFRTKLIWWSIISLVLMAVLGLGGYAIYRTSWTQGYQAGQRVVASGIAPAVPGAVDASGLLLTIGIILVLLFVVGKILRTMFWLSLGSGMATGWRRDWQRYHHPHSFRRAPWCYGWDEDSQKDAEAPEQSAAKA